MVVPGNPRDLCALAVPPRTVKHITYHVVKVHKRAVHAQCSSERQRIGQRLRSSCAPRNLPRLAPLRLLLRLPALSPRLCLLQLLLLLLQLPGNDLQEHACMAG